MLRLLLLTGSTAFAIGNHTLAYRDGLHEWQKLLESGLGMAIPVIHVFDQNDGKNRPPAGSQQNPTNPMMTKGTVMLRLGNQQEVCRLLQGEVATVSTRSALPVLLSPGHGLGAGAVRDGTWADKSASLAAAARTAHVVKQSKLQEKGSSYSSLYLRQHRIDTTSLRMPKEAELVVVQSSDLCKRQSDHAEASSGDTVSRSRSPDTLNVHRFQRLAAALEVSAAVRTLTATSVPVRVVHVGTGPALSSLAGKSDVTGTDISQEILWIDATKAIAEVVNAWAMSISNPDGTTAPFQLPRLIATSGVSRQGPESPAATSQAAVTSSSETDVTSLQIFDTIGLYVRLVCVGAIDMVCTYAAFLGTAGTAVSDTVGTTFSTGAQEIRRLGSWVTTASGAAWNGVAAVPAVVMTAVLSAQNLGANVLGAVWPVRARTTVAVMANTQPQFVYIDCEPSGLDAEALCNHLNSPQSPVRALPCKLLADNAYDHRSSWSRMISSVTPRIFSSTAEMAENKLVVVARKTDGQAMLAARIWSQRGYRVLALVQSSELRAESRAVEASKPAATIDKGAQISYFSLAALSDRLLADGTERISRALKA